MLGWRTKDLDKGFLPFLSGQGITQYTSDPVFNDLLKKFEPDPELQKSRPINFTTLRNDKIINADFMMVKF